MSKLTTKIALPIIIASIFAITAFVALEKDNIQSNASFYVVMTLMVIYVFSFGFATGQNFVSPIKKILDRANELNRGDFSSRVYLETKDELADLARTFNGIAERLEESRIKEEGTEKTIDIKVRARTQALEETINALEQKIQNRTLELEKMQKELEQVKNNARTA